MVGNTTLESRQAARHFVRVVFPIEAGDESYESLSQLGRPVVQREDVIGIAVMEASQPLFNCVAMGHPLVNGAVHFVLVAEHRVVDEARYAGSGFLMAESVRPTVYAGNDGIEIAAGFGMEE